MRGSSCDREMRQPIIVEVVKLISNSVAMQGERGVRRKLESIPSRHADSNKTKTYHDNEGDCSEDKLKINHSRHREVRVATGGGERGLLEQLGHGDNWARYTADRDPLFSEAHLVGPNDPADEDGGKGVKRHESRVDGPFPLHDTCVQDNETGYALKSD